MSEQAKILSFDEARSHRDSSRRSVRSRAQHASSSSQHQRSQGLSSSRVRMPDQGRRVSGVQNASHNARVSQAYLGVSSQRSSSSVSPRRSARVTEEGSSRCAVPRARSQNKTSDDLTFMQSLKKRARSMKADREFNKTIGAKEQRAQETTSRAALYEMRMGRTQKRSSRMQTEHSSAPSRKAFGFLPSRLISWMNPALASRFLIAGCCVLFTFVMLYQPLADYYGESRQLQQLEAEYSALEEHNASLQAEIDYLNTDAGLEDYARYKLGYIRADEQVATVDNVEPSTNTTESTGSISYALPAGSVSAPDTWYSGVLDVVFGYGS